MLKKTPLYESHIELSAKMVDFAGWEMPMLYSSIIEEHMKVRNSCGMFDVSHMGDILIKGNSSKTLLSSILTNNIELATDGKGIYSHLLRPNGTIIDDVIVYKLRTDEYLLVPNASTKDVVLDWIENHNQEAEIIDLSNNLACIALQGPMAETILQRLTEYDLKGIGRFKFALIELNLSVEEQNSMRLLFPDNEFKSLACMACRTGYTGEDGFELIIESEHSPKLWKSLLQIGGEELSPAGLGCRDTLRLEKGMLLSGTDFNDNRSSIETGPRWVVKFDHEFIGRNVVEAQVDDPELNVLVGIVLDEKGIPRQGHPIMKDEKVIGEVTSGTISPVLKKGIALGFVPRRFSRKDERVQIDVRGKLLEGRVVKMPFV